MSRPTPKPNGSPGAVPSLPDPVFNDPKHHLRIYQGDCLEILGKIPQESVDLMS